MVPSARVYFSVQLITICAVVNLKCAPEKASCAVVICAVVKYLPNQLISFQLLVIKLLSFCQK